MQYLWAFLVGGLICFIGQILINYTKLTPARILTGFVVAGVIAGALGWYEKLEKFAGAGATVPIVGFGALLAKGVKTAVADRGVIGVFTGGLTAAAGGITGVIIFSVIVALFFKHGDKMS